MRSGTKRRAGSEACKRDQQARGLTSPWCREYVRSHDISLVSLNSTRQRVRERIVTRTDNFASDDQVTVNRSKEIYIDGVVNDFYSTVIDS